MDYEVQGEKRTIKVLHHGALFACTRWTNLYFPGDFISGPLASVFGRGVQDLGSATTGSYSAVPHALLVAGADRSTAARIGRRPPRGAGPRQQELARMSASTESARAAIREFDNQGYCVLRGHFPPRLVEACREAFWTRLLAYLDGGPGPNRGTQRHYLPMPFESPASRPSSSSILPCWPSCVVSWKTGSWPTEWGCGVPLPGSEYQEAHVDYQRPLFPEAPTLPLPPFALVVNFGLVGSPG